MPVADRFVSDKCPDGTQLEVSALQSAYNIIADRDREHFDTEYQNDPPLAIGVWMSVGVGGRA